MSARPTLFFAMLGLAIFQPGCDPAAGSRDTSARANEEPARGPPWAARREDARSRPRAKEGATGVDRESRARPDTERGLKIYVSVDMEGVAGVVTSAQLGPEGFEYGRFRELMTREVATAIDAAYEGGAAGVLVSDSHGNGQNLLLEDLPPEVQVVRSWPRPLGMMEGIDESFDGAILLGYHASTVNPNGVRAHTISSGKLTDIRMNGRSVSEAQMSAAVAGHFGVPVIMVSGDDVCIEETRAALGDVEGAVVKWSLSYESARTLTPEAARETIRRHVTAAMARIAEFRPYVIETPVKVEVWFKYNRPSEVLAYLPVFERVESRGVRFAAKDMLEASRFLRFVMSYDPGLTP